MVFKTHGRPPRLPSQQRDGIRANTTKKSTEEPGSVKSRLAFGWTQKKSSGNANASGGTRNKLNGRAGRLTDRKKQQQRSDHDAADRISGSNVIGSREEAASMAGESEILSLSTEKNHRSVIVGNLHEIHGFRGQQSASRYKTVPEQCDDSTIVTLSTVGSMDIAVASVTSGGGFEANLLVESQDAALRSAMSLVTVKTDAQSVYELKSVRTDRTVACRTHGDTFGARRDTMRNKNQARFGRSLPRRNARYTGEESMDRESNIIGDIPSTVSKFVGRPTAIGDDEESTVVMIPKGDKYACESNTCVSSTIPNSEKRTDKGIASTEKVTKKCHIATKVKRLSPTVGIDQSNSSCVRGNDSKDESTSIRPESVQLIVEKEDDSQNDWDMDYQASWNDMERLQQEHQETESICHGETGQQA